MNKELTEKLEGVRAYLVSQNANRSACAVYEAIAALRAEPVAGQLSAETIEEWREWWHNMPYKDGEIAQVNQICDAALSSLRGTFADGIEAVLSDAELHLSERQRSRIRALAQGQRPSEQDADELPVHVADALIHQIKSGASFDRSVMLIALGQLRAHLSRKEPK